MVPRPSVIETLVRDSFGLILKIRGEREAARLLALANEFLRTLLRDPETRAPQVVLSVQAVRLRKFQV